MAIMSHSDSDNAGNTRNKTGSKNTGATPFTQSFSVQVRGEGDSASTETDAARFRENSDRMAARALQDTRDTLIWVNKFGEGPADRAALRTAVRSPTKLQPIRIETESDSLLVGPHDEAKSIQGSHDRAVGQRMLLIPRLWQTSEEGVRFRQAGGACPSSPPAPPCVLISTVPQYRIQLRSRKVTDTSATTKFCSDQCAKRSAWFEGVCLNRQDGFSSFGSGPASSEPIQLLEDIEEQQHRQSASTADSSPSVSDMISFPNPDDRTLSTSDSFSSEADNFLARLSVIERHPTSVPSPPTLSSSVRAPDDRLSSAAISARQSARSGGAGSALLPFDMTNVQRELVASQQGVRAALSSTEDGEGAEESRARRIEIDVDPENRETLDMGWELLKQMRESGEMA